MNQFQLYTYLLYQPDQHNTKIILTSFISPFRWTDASNTRKLLQSDNNKITAKGVISPAPAPAPHKHHHHKHSSPTTLKPQRISPAPSSLPLPLPLPRSHNPQPKHKPVNRTVPVHSSQSVKPPLAKTILKGKHVKSLHLYGSVIGGVSFLLVISVVLFVCIRTKKVVAVRPWATGLSGQLQKAFVKGKSLLS